MGNFHGGKRDYWRIDYSDRQMEKIFFQKKQIQGSTENKAILFKTFRVRTTVASAFASPQTSWQSQKPGKIRDDRHGPDGFSLVKNVWETGFSLNHSAVLFISRLRRAKSDNLYPASGFYTWMRFVFFNCPEPAFFWFVPGVWISNNFSSG